MTTTQSPPNHPSPSPRQPPHTPEQHGHRLAPTPSPPDAATDLDPLPPQLVDVTALRRNRRRRIQVPRWIRRLSGPVLLLLVWQVASSIGLLDPKTLAPPSDVADTFWELASSGRLATDLWVSLQRVLFGLAIGVSVGLFLALVAGLFRLGEDLVDSTMQVLRATPVLAIVPLIILWLGIGEEAKIALIAIGVVFPVYINTYASIRGVDDKLVETATTFGVSRIGLVRAVIVPGALPGFLVSLRFALAIAWLVLVISEQVNATSGIGYLMNNARTFARTDIIVVGLIIYGILGLLSDVLVRFLERRLLSWRRSFNGT